MTTTYYSIEPSPLRVATFNRLCKEYPDVPREEVREAMELRNNIPNFAKEFLERKHLTKLSEEERFPLWTGYLNWTDKTKVGNASWD